MANLDIDRVSYRIRAEDIDPVYLRKLVVLAYDEDLSGAGWKNSILYQPMDVTTDTVIEKGQGKVHISARKEMRFAGKVIFDPIFEVYQFSGSVTWFVEDGDPIVKGERLATIEGDKATILKMERVILNFLQHLSGIATNTAEYTKLIKGSDTRLLDTRKTTPGYRVLEKYAVACGGAWNHRMGLYDRVLIKDNHLAASGSTIGDRLQNSVLIAKNKNPDLLIEVEVDHIDQIRPVLEAGADIIMLDNFLPERVAESVSIIKKRAFIEVSGGITKETLQSYCLPGVDFISCGALVHQSQWIDIGFDWE